MKLLESIDLAGHTCKNRVVMAPMTRSRASIDGVVGPSVVTYYTQRASAGLIISEAINISKQATGSPLTPGLYTREQIDAWKNVTKSVHEHDGLIYAQLWHTGRVGHSLVKNGELPVAPSPAAIPGQKHYTMEGPQDYEVPRELALDEISEIIQQYGQAAANAIEAGFDGVELHAAFGYLPNQFLAESSNQRTDAYGGSHANRNRFVIEVMRALVDAVGANNAAIRLSPTSTYNGIVHQDPVAQFTMLVDELNALPLAYVHFMNVPFDPTSHPNYPSNTIEAFGSSTKHPIIANCGYTRESGEAELENSTAHMISYGTLFLANPDLPRRFALNAELNSADRATMYGGGDHGYIDYPLLND